MAPKSTNTGQSRGRKPSAPTSQSGVLRPLKDRQKLDLVIDAVSAVEVTEFSAWKDLDSLSTHTSVEEIEAVPEGIFEDGENGFAAVATVYVDLNYGDKADGVSSSDSFPVQVQGHFASDGKAIVDDVSVDTSSFYV